MPDTGAAPVHDASRDLARRAQALARIRLRHLQCFLATAEAGHLGRAAQALRITQPAVTKTLNELEDMLGVALFIRGRRGAVMTAEAEVFLRHATSTVQALTAAVDSVVGRPQETLLCIGVLPTASPSLMPAVLAGFLAERPQVAVRVHTGRNAALIEQLRARELDAVIGRLSEPDLMVGLTFEHLYAEPLVLVLRPGHPLFEAAPAARRGRALPPAPLPAAFASPGFGDHPLLVPLPGTLIRQVADAFLIRQQWIPRAGLVETLDSALARAMVLGGDACWITPLGAVALDLQSGALRRWPVDITPEEPIGLMQRSDALPSPALQALLGLVRLQAAVRRERLA